MASVCLNPWEKTVPLNAETSPARAGRAEAPTVVVAPDPKRWFALAVISVCQLMLVLDSSIMNIALPHAQHALGISDADRQWVVTAYTLGFGGLLLLGGRVADFVGRKRVFIAGLLGFAVASALGGIANNGPLLYASRGLQGVFAAAMAPAALSLLTTTFTEPRERARAFSVYGGISGGGAALGLVLGGLLTQYASWRWCLLVNVPIALVTAAAAGYLLRESRATGITRYDLRGALLATAGLTALVYGFANAGTHGWASPSTVAVLVGAVVLLVVFFTVEAGNEHALLPLRLLRNRDRAGAYLTATLSAAGLLSMFLFLTFYLQGTLGYSALRTGVAFLPFSLGVAAGAAIAGRVLPRVGPRVPLAAGSAFAGLGLVWFSQVGVGSSFLVHVLPGEILASVGLGLVFVTVSSAGLIGVGRDDAGVASALVNTTQQIGGALGTAILSTVAFTRAADYATSHNPTPQLPLFAAVDGYQAAFLVGAIIATIGLVATLTMVPGGTAEALVADEATEPAAA